MRAIIVAAVIAVSPLFMYMSCRHSTTANNSDCDGVMCTQMFAMVTLQVRGSDGEPVKLDDSYTLRVKTGEKNTFAEWRAA